MDEVGRITDAGVETFPVGDAPKGIAVEPDGDVWFDGWTTTAC